MGLGKKKGKIPKSVVYFGCPSSILCGVLFWGANLWMFGSGLRVLGLGFNVHRVAGFGFDSL